MDILNKEYAKYARPMFFHIGRVVLYLLSLLILLGAYSRIEDSQFIYINFFILCFIFLFIVIIDVVIGMKKAQSYKTHKVKFVEEFVLFVDHRGAFQLPYTSLKSYQMISDQIILKTKANRFIISGKHHGISFDELKEMVNYLVSQNVENKINREFIYFVAGFFVVNYGADYVFRNILQLSSDVSLFGTLYIMMLIGLSIVLWDKWNLQKIQKIEELQ